MDGVDRDFAEFARLREQGALVCRGSTSADHRHGGGDTAMGGRDEQLQAEARWLVANYIQREMGHTGAPLSWADIERVRSAYLRATAPGSHQCAPSTCRHVFVPCAGTRFDDPLSGRPCVSSGDVYVCCTTGAVHVCGAGCDSETLSQNAGYECSISGRFRGSLLSDEETFREREDRLGVSSSGAPLARHQVGRVNMRASSARKRTAGSDARRPAAKRSAAAAAAAGGADAAPPVKPDIRQVVGAFVCGGALLAQLERQIADEDAALIDELRATAARGQPLPDAVALASAVNRRYGYLVPSALRLRAARRAMPDGVMPRAECLYLQQAVDRLFALLRRTPYVGSSASKDINLRNMCVPLLYVLWRGLHGHVSFSRRTGEMCDRRLCAADEPVPVGSAAFEATVRREHYVFVPAHRWLAALLPDPEALPGNSAVASSSSSSSNNNGNASSEPCVDTGNLMKRTRRIHQCFLSTLGAPRVRPSDFCLALPECGSATRA